MVSIFGLIIAAYLSVYGNKLEEEMAFHNILVGSTFGTICFLGSLASIFPNTCVKITSYEKTKKSITIHSTEKSTSRGHHYPCEEYSNHILSVGKKYFCATCSGLLLGAIIGIMGTILYFSGYFNIERISNLAPLGIISVAFGIFQSILPKMSGAMARFFAGILLVLGSFVLLISLDQTVNSTSVELFFIAVSVFWVFTKINLSQREHRLTCLNCSTKQC